MKLPTLLCALLLSASPLAAQDLAVRAGALHTVSGPVIEDAVVVVRGGKIAAFGPAASTPVPEGLRVLEAAVVTPGLIDAHSVVGLAGYLNQDQDQDHHDPGAEIQPELRAIDAYNARERLIEWVRGFGVTTVHTGHAPLALISGQTLVAKTRGETVEQAVIVPRAMIAATLGADSRREGGGKSPGTAGKQLAMLRSAFLEAQEYQGKLEAAVEDETKRPERDLRKEALVALLRREVPLLITAQRHQDIASALRLAAEFDLRIVLDGAAEAYLMLDELRAADVPVILHPPMARYWGELENASRSTPIDLQRSGLSFTVQSGYEGYVPKTRVVLYEAAIAAAHGMGQQAALKMITLDAATILGLQDRIGSIEVGKDGDLALYDGDPFEYTSHCVGTVIDGEVQFEGER
jgi:imidazolonepropionase-like amidohydrolase